MSTFSACEELVRRHDPDRYFSALFAPAGKRPFLFALYAFHYEVARIPDIVREPMIGDIRLAWWRETVEGARAGTPRNHDVAKALAETLAANDLPQEHFDRIVEARARDLAPEPFTDMGTLETYCNATSGSAMRLAARVLGEPSDDLAHEAGVAFALAGMLQAVPFHAARGKPRLTDDLLDDVKRAARNHLAAARKLAKPREALPAFMPAALVPLYLKKNDPPLWRKQIALLGAAMRGQI